MEQTNRRDFLRDTTLLGAGLAGIGWSGVRTTFAASDDAAKSPAARSTPTPLGSGAPFVMGIIGVGARGLAVAGGFAATPGVVVKYVCDVDDAQIPKAVAAVNKRRAAAASQPADKAGGAGESPSKPSGPVALKDFRLILDDKDVH